MKISVHQPQYLPWLGYFDKIQKSDIFVFLNNVQYKKREFQNRNKIRVKNGSIWLTIPVITKNKYFQKISEVEIDNSENWAHDHWKSIELNYLKADHFTDYKNILSEFYQRRWDKLADINIQFIKLLLEFFNIKTPIYFESDLNINSTSSQRIIDICKILNADTYLSGQGGKDYIDEKLFENNNIKLIYQDFNHPVYKQNYEGFEPYMSIIDYLLNCGTKGWG